MQDYRLQHALPKFLEALSELSPDTWHSCLHVSTSPIPRAVGDVDGTILNKGLSPISDFPLPQACGIPWSRSFTGMVLGTLTWRRVGRMGGGWSHFGFPTRWRAWSLLYG